MKLMKEISQNRPTSEPNLPLPPPLPTTVDSHQASTSFTFQPPIPDPTITVNLTLPNNDLPFPYYPTISNAELHPSITIPP
ncbi:hypothetical protein P3X46_004842, partial [Hevea brasiliensis]